MYKEALEIIEKDIPRFGMGSFSLCLLLPCILWDLKTASSLTPDGKHWDYIDTIIAFPELKSFLKDNTRKTNEERIAFLKQTISTLNNKS